MKKRERYHCDGLSDAAVIRSVDFLIEKQPHRAATVLSETEIEQIFVNHHLIQQRTFATKNILLNIQKQFTKNPCLEFTLSNVAVVTDVPRLEAEAQLFFYSAPDVPGKEDGSEIFMHCTAVNPSISYRDHHALAIFPLKLRSITDCGGTLNGS